MMNGVPDCWIPRKDCSQANLCDDVLVVGCEES